MESLPLPRKPPAPGWAAQPSRATVNAAQNEAVVVATVNTTPASRNWTSDVAIIGDVSVLHECRSSSNDAERPISES